MNDREGFSERELNGYRNLAETDMHRERERERERVNRQREPPVADPEKNHLWFISVTKKP